MITNPEHVKTVARVGEELKKLRIKAGYPKHDLFAFKNGLPRVQYWRMEKGTNFTFKGLLRILDIHKLTLPEFFSKLM